MSRCKHTINRTRIDEELAKLPTWDECSALINAGDPDSSRDRGDLTELHKFIHENEPEGYLDAEIFRGLLARLIIYLRDGD